LERDRAWEREVERERERMRAEQRRESRARRDEGGRRESRTRRESGTRRERERVPASDDEYDYRRAREKPRREEKGREKGKYLGVADTDNDEEYDRRRRRKGEKPPEVRKRSGARVVSGAVLEEGRGKGKRLRGGGWSNSYEDSVDKEKEGFGDEAVKKKKRKLCEYWKLWCGIPDGFAN